jgi:hypothetical protein
MSKLEDDAKQILIPLMAGEREVVQLNKDERFVLARWTAKTAYVLNSSSNFVSNVPADHFKHVHMNLDSLPQNVAVVAQQHHGETRFYWFQHQFFLKSDIHPYVENTEEARALVQPSYKVSFLFRKLLLLVGFWPWPGWNIVLWSGIHVPLWPHQGPVGRYSKDPIAGGFPWFDSLAALTVFHQTFGVVRADRAAALN